MVKGALVNPLLMYMRIFFFFDGDNQRFNLDLPMQPGTIRNK